MRRSPLLTPPQLGGTTNSATKQALFWLLLRRRIAALILGLP
jgi:hypothetical protein